MEKGGWKPKDVDTVIDQLRESNYEVNPMGDRVQKLPIWILHCQTIGTLARLNLRKFFENSFIAIPLWHDGHYVLIVYQPQTRALCYIDALCYFPMETIYWILEKMTKGETRLEIGKWVVLYKVPVQRDAYSCSAYVLAGIKALMTVRAVEWEDTIPRLQPEMLDALKRAEHERKSKKRKQLKKK